MQPFAWRDTPLADVFAAQDLLTNQRHHDSMIHVVVRSIAIGNIFHCQSSDEPDDAGITGLKHPVDLLILLLELFNKRVDDDLDGVKHCNLHPNKRPAMRRTHSRYGLCTISRSCTKSQEAAQKPKNLSGLFAPSVSRIINRYG